jgi:hypothetical protein
LSLDNEMIEKMKEVNEKTGMPISRQLENAWKEKNNKEYKYMSNNKEYKELVKLVSRSTGKKPMLIHSSFIKELKKDAKLDAKRFWGDNK